MKKHIVATVFIGLVFLIVPQLLFSQPLPPGGPGGGGGGVSGAPIDGASWLLPAGLAAYAWFKKKFKRSAA